MTPELIRGAVADLETPLCDLDTARHALAIYLEDHFTAGLRHETLYCILNTLNQAAERGDVAFKALWTLAFPTEAVPANVVPSADQRRWAGEAQS